MAETAYVVADCQLPTAELLRLDEPAECCAILPHQNGGPWGSYWRPFCSAAPAPPMPSGRPGDEYAFAIRPLTRELAAQYQWSWTLERRTLSVPSRQVHEELGFPQPYIISPRWWTDVLATLPWRAMANFDLADLAAGLYRIFLLPRCEADGGVRAIVVADKQLVERAKHKSDAKRKKRLVGFFESIERFPPLGEWLSTSAAAAQGLCGAPTAQQAMGATVLSGWALKSKRWGFGSNRYYCTLSTEPLALCYWPSIAESTRAPPKGVLTLQGAAVEDCGTPRLRLTLADGSRVTFALESAREHEVWLTELREACLGAPPRLARLASSGRYDETPVAEGAAEGSHGLFPHQLRTVEWMDAIEVEEQGGLWRGAGGMASIGNRRVRLPSGGLIAHPPGAGKTRCVAELLRRRCERAGSSPGHTVVFAPAHLAQQWRAELDTHAGAAAGCTSIHDFSAAPALPAGCVRVIIDEPQDALRGANVASPMSSGQWTSLLGAALRAQQRRPCVWALCGTATEHVREIAELLLFDEPCRDDDARALAAIALVHRRADTYPNPGLGPNLNPNPEL